MTEEQRDELIEAVFCIFVMFPTIVFIVVVGLL